MWARFNLKDLQKAHPRSSDRSFAFLMGMVFTALFILKGYTFFLAGAAAFFVGGAVYPRVFSFLNQAWQILGLLLGWLMTPMILFLLYFVVFVPMVSLVKLFGHRALAHKSGWIEKTRVCRFDKIF